MEEPIGLTPTHAGKDHHCGSVNPAAVPTPFCPSTNTFNPKPSQLSFHRSPASIQDARSPRRLPCCHLPYPRHSAFGGVCGWSYIRESSLLEGEPLKLSIWRRNGVRYLQEVNDVGEGNHQALP